jgi:hypothetical protein
MSYYNRFLLISEYEVLKILKAEVNEAPILDDDRMIILP